MLQLKLFEDRELISPIAEGSTIVVWFSNGAASAVAAKKTIELYGETCLVRVVNNPVIEEHPDNQRFLKDVEQWIGQPIEIAINPKFPACSAVEVWDKKQAMSFPQGAPCTVELKKHARLYWESLNHADWLVMGFTADELDRSDRFRQLERSNLLPVLIDLHLSKQDCIDLVVAAGIVPPEMYRLGFPNNNCFTADTRFLTKQGVTSLGDVVGKSVKVRTLGKGTPWRDAQVRSFGFQNIVELVLRRGSAQKVINTTMDHRWFVGTQKHYKEVTTIELKAGDRLVSSHARIHSRIAPSPWGIAQGITFGDGTLPASCPGATARLVLCGEKKKELLRFFSLSPRKDIAAGIEITGLPRNWKEVPSLAMDDSFLFGWLAGYFATDGCASQSGDYSISSSCKKNLEFARDVAIRLGISVGQIRTCSRQGINGIMSDLYILPLIGFTLKEEFFLLAEHRRRFADSNPRQPHPWFVESVNKTDRIEEVFCVVEPVSKTFVLEDNILTGNCIGCCKATSPTYWNLVRSHFPEIFQQRAEQSRRLGVRLVRVKNARIFLDELDPNAIGDPLESLQIECGIFCEETENHEQP